MALKNKGLLKAMAIGASPLAALGLGTKTGRNFIFGKPDRYEQRDIFTPEQQSALSELLQQGLSGVRDPYQGFEPIAKQARSRFQTQTIPSIAERFTSLGQGAQRSSDFTGALAGAGAGLDEALAALQSNYGMQNKQLSSQLAQLGLTPMFEEQFRPGTGGLLGGLVSSDGLAPIMKMLFGL